MVADLFERAGARPAAPGVDCEAAVVDILPFEQVDDVGDVGVERGLKPRWRSGMLEHDASEPFGLVDP